MYLYIMFVNQSFRVIHIKIIIYILNTNTQIKNTHQISIIINTYAVYRRIHNR